MLDAYPRRVVNAITLRLPPPISTNALYRSFVRNGKPTTIKSARYRKWIAEAGAMLETQHPGCIVGSYALEIALPAKSRLDVGNVEKGINDLLELHRVIENDRLCDDLHVWRGQGAETVVFISAMEGAP